MLVCVGAALFMIVSIEGFGDALHHPNDSLDPSRVAAQVASGIGFLDAGALLKRRGVMHGLHTAASLWALAAHGLAVGGVVDRKSFVWGEALSGMVDNVGG